MVIAACSNPSNGASHSQDSGDVYPIDLFSTADASSDTTPPDAVLLDTPLPDVPPAPPLFERGQVIPPNSLPCLEADGTETLSCNHLGSVVSVEADGTVLLVWYHGKHEKSKDSRIVWSRRPPGGVFGPVEVLFDAPDLAEGNPAIWVHEDGTLYLFFVTVLGESWNDAEIRLIRSEDRGEIDYSADPQGFMDHMSQIQNSLTHRYPTAVALSDDEGLTWSAVANIDPPCPEGEQCSHGYNSIAQDPTDQSLWISYTDGRGTIGWVYTNEAWITGQGDAFVTGE